MTSLEEHARHVVALQPDAPRHVDLWPLVTRSYASRAGRIVTATGLILGLPVVVVGIVAEGSLFSKALLLSVAGAVTVWLLAGAAIRAWRVSRALATGGIADAVVIRSTWTGPRLRPETIDAQEHGFARGTWRVAHSSGDFEAVFESDAPWAARLKKGARARVLVDAHNPRVLLDLGPIEEAPRL